MVFPPCRAAAAILVAVSPMSATTATGGVPRRTVAATLTTGTWATAASSWATTTAIRATCSVFGACRTEAKPAASRKASGVDEKKFALWWCGTE